jgi:hypothetical protein
MKQPIEVGENVLKYPKALFSLQEVVEEKEGMGTPDAWTIEQDTKNYFLLFSPARATVIRLDKKKHKKVPDFMKL